MTINIERSSTTIGSALEEVLASAEEGFCIFDRHGCLIYINRSYLDLYAAIADVLKPGTSVERIVARESEWRLSSGMTDDIDKWIARRLGQHAGSETTTREERIPGDRCLQRRVSRTDDGGSVEFVCDVTALTVERDNTEQRNALLRCALDNIPQGFVTYDADLRLIIWNKIYLELLELPHRFAQVGTPLRDILTFMAKRGDFGAGRAETRAEEAMTRSLSPAPLHFERESPDGKILEIWIRPLDGGGLVATYNDVTESQVAVRRLHESEERYALAAAGSNDGLWDWNLRTNKIFYSERWKDMLGLGNVDVTDSPEEWLSRIHLDDVVRVETVFDRHLNGTASHFEIEHRVHHTDQSLRWMLVRGLAVRDEKGMASRFAGSQTDITDRKLAEQEAIHGALHDTLTGLANRTLFLERMRHSLSRSKRFDTASFAVIYLDLDRFKLVNESLGHAHGDELIVATSRRIEQSLKFGDTVARLGGDEFAILMEDVGSQSDAKHIADSLQMTLAAPFTLRGKEVFTTASMGIAHSNAGYDRLEDILRDAELAMYRAKEFGKAQSVVFDVSFRKSLLAPVDLDTDMRRALEREEMSLHYQPIVSLTTGRICGFEALMRWDHGYLGTIAPSDFIPLAEETGLIDTLGKWVLRQACKQMLIWNTGRAENQQLEISVNLSSRQFSHLNLVSEIVENLQVAGLAASSLKLEITESALMGNAHRSVEMLNQLKELDIKICVDDFGTGYSSLSYLHTFPIDTLKIDKSFIHGMGRNRQNLEIVRTITMLARNLRLDVIAEGVEDSDQHTQLQALGCQFAQGYYFSEPIDADAATSLLLENRYW